MLKTKGFIEPKGSKRDFKGGRRGFCRVARLSLQAQAVNDSIEPEALRAGGWCDGWVCGMGGWCDGWVC